MMEEEVTEPLAVRAQPPRPDIRLMMRRLEELAEFGALPGGAQHRLPYTQTDQHVRELFAGWARAAGMQVEMDAAGNVIGRLAGRRPELAPVMVGSHLDTQPYGGKYDGIAGSLAALAVAESLLAADARPDRTIEVVVWAGEEGSGRFDVGCIGSRAMIGGLTDEHLGLRCRNTGETLAEAMRGCGLAPESIGSCERAPGSIHAVLELHIEQGPYLEESGIALGVVEAISGNRRIPLEIEGVQAHSGAQPMTHRRDALNAAAEIILMAESEVLASVTPVVATSGQFDHFPHSIAAVPGRSELTIDLRSSSSQTLLEKEQAVRRGVEEICARRGVGLRLEPSWGMDPTRTDEALVEVLRDACAEAGETSMLMDSGAGHDSLMLGKRFPAGVLFVPSRDGLSHCPEEFTAEEDLARGLSALQIAVLRASAAGSLADRRHRNEEGGS